MAQEKYLIKKINADIDMVSSKIEILSRLRNEVMDIVTSDCVQQEIQPDNYEIHSSFESVMTGLIQYRRELTQQLSIFRKQAAGKYLDEFEVINGLRQHKNGLTFDEWLIL